MQVRRRGRRGDVPSLDRGCPARRPRRRTSATIANGDRRRATEALGLSHFSLFLARSLTRLAWSVRVRHGGVAWRAVRGRWRVAFPFLSRFLPFSPRLVSSLLVSSLLFSRDRPLASSHRLLLSFFPSPARVRLPSAPRDELRRAPVSNKYGLPYALNVAQEADGAARRERWT